MKIYVCRHGETEGNVQKILMGCLMDTPLTSLGENQARELGVRLKNVEFDKVFVSSNKRAKDTLEIAYGGVDFFVDDRLREQSFGEMTGTCIYDIPDEIDAEWKKDPFVHRHVGGESLKDLIVRVSDFLDYLKGLEFENVLIFTHCNVMKAVEVYFGMKEREAMFLKIENCEMREYDFDDLISSDE